MPESIRGKSAYLSELMSIPPGWLSFLPDNDACELLTDVCLYYHLDRFDRPTVIAKINSLPGQKQDMLRTKILMPMVNPDWGLWSLPTAELIRRHDFVDAVSQAGSLAGVTFSVSAGAGFVSKLRTVPANVAMRGFVPMVVIWGFFWLNDQSKSLIQEEVFRRAAVH